ncbi:MAG: YlxR family protein [Actinobacteria bacterium]|nr:YlxR family protein [Actinomycetota bacterium]
MPEAGVAVRQPPDGSGSLVEPVRTCVGCRGRDVRSVLLRVVAAEVDGVWSVVPDPHRRLPGRGASLHPVTSCLELAERRRAFPRALRRSGVPDTTALAEYVAGSSRPPVTVLTGSGSDADEHPMRSHR